MIIKKDTKFRVLNINPLWKSMGVTKEENNGYHPNWDDNFTGDLPRSWVIDGRIWTYDGEYCDDYEVIEQTWCTNKDREEEEIFQDFVGYGIGDGHLYEHFNLTVENCIEIQTITEEEFENLTDKPLNLKLYRETLKEVTNDLDKIVLNKIGVKK